MEISAPLMVAAFFAGCFVGSLTGAFVIVTRVAYIALESQRSKPTDDRRSD